MQGLTDMHIHSYFSDGTMSPAEIVKEAKERGLSFISICDHNELEGSRQAAEICENEGLKFIPAVEIDSLNNDVDYHIIGYGVDLNDTDFIKFIIKNRELLDAISVKLIEKMSADFNCLSPQDFDGFTYDRSLGGWKCLHYLYERGIASSIKDALKFYDAYQCPYSIVDFPPVQTVCEQIHKAGGYAVLAHPGEVIKQGYTDAFRKELERLLPLGIDGIECYYPTHTKEITEECLRVCRGSDLIITAGSDCHGSFGKTSIGEIHIAVEQINLKGLII